MNNRSLEQELKHYFGFDAFKTGQKEIITDVMNGKDVLGILPTGSGKSICYQLPAVLSEGVTVVVSPLVSLMVDQVKALKATGFKRVTAINSFLSPVQKKQLLSQLAHYKLIYVSPEMLQNNIVVEQLQALHISLFVVDEAHCISQWGHEFRTDYLKLAKVIELFNQPTVLALSGTATPEVQEDIISQLGMIHRESHIYPMDKENISFAIEHVEHPNEKLMKIEQLLKDQYAPTMIYFSSRQWAERASGELSKQLSDKRVAFYHGGMEQSDRLLIQQQFMNDQLDIICCTSAFGMGINKKNIRYVIHFHLPTQTESFIQEVGRAGRDGAHSISVVYYSPSDDFLPKKLIQSELPEAGDIQKTLNYLFNLYQAGAKLPADELVQEELELTETQWRFIKYHCHQHHLLNQQAIVFNRDKWKEFYTFLTNQVDNRYKYKMAKFSELMRWVHSQACRRKGLYQPFQNSVKTPDVPCCDYCGFDWRNFSFGQKETVIFQQDWHDRLREIFLQGDKHE
ncbi:ATP-dependent DNA helicase RecQ [Thalassobacillus cyri]|uniref:ATP-dependent DNA helicase RecQ n=1 Tax=Thalassobacillus cyri TaxID=571932 RepID=A0A1H4CIW3_9BACI|nr:ATP-dependent DNA helicase RecQ [Thalassobacillus cyri]SEA60365.1 ATP-dependent DNA helicase RecQ [Thalassobacillus cyri]